MQKAFFNKIKKVLKKASFIASNGKTIRRAITPLRAYMARQTTKPLSDYYGFDRGVPIDRFYIERFLEKNKSHIKGACLEILDDTYTKTFGKERVSKSDILDIDKGNKNATIIADLRHMPEVASNSYDSIIITQVLQFIDDPVSALKEIHRILKPGGHVLATMPVVSRVDCASGIDGDFWRFTEASAKTLFKHFEDARIESHGNCRIGMYFLAGASQEDVSRKILDTDDRQFPLIITALAKK